MAKVPKHRRIKRATVLIKRTRCIRNQKSNKTYPPLYQKLKVNNHSLARALSQEKQENQLLFSRNVELLAEVQDLVHSCNNRDLVITNVLKYSKDMMQALVTMSGFLTNTISLCQEYVSNNQSNIHRTSTSSTGRRESTRRMSTKSPARGVVKPMVSGHTITKPTINLSRVNMQRLQNVNLSIIEEGPGSPDNNLDRSVENRRSRTLPERVSTLRVEDDEERVLVNRRTNRFSGARLSSSGRYSKRNSGRLSGGVLAARLSKRSSEFNELVKSPRVTLQDVSRYLSNNQTVNVRLLSESTRSSNIVNNVTAIEDSQESDQSNPETTNHATIIPETQVDSCETSDSDQEINNTVCQRKSALSTKSSRTSNETSSNNTTSFESRLIDPLEGPSWLFDSSSRTPRRRSLNGSRSIESRSMGRLEGPTWLFDSPMELDDNRTVATTAEEEQLTTSPVSSRSNEIRINSTVFRVPELPKNYRPNTGDNDDDDDDDDDDGERRVNLAFITQRRGGSTKAPSVHAVNGFDSEEEEERDTLMLNIESQLRKDPQRALEEPERLQFDMNEFLQLTPLKPLLNISSRLNNRPAHVDDAPEPTATIQLTQNLPRHQEGTERLSTIPQIELPRLTDVLNRTDDNHQQSMILTPENNKQTEGQKRKRIISKAEEPLQSASEDNDDEVLVQRKKKPTQRKKKSKGKDPSTAKVVLQKLNETHRTSAQGENVRSDNRKNSDESVTSARSSRQDPSSDSESSTASFSSKQIPMRPRRQKAPKNLQEPSLSKKLRRID